MIPVMNVTRQYKSIRKAGCGSTGSASQRTVYTGKAGGGV